jgi:triosephosphate isomerase
VEPDLRKPLIVGNWKMHSTVEETIKLITALKNLLVDAQHIEVVLAPPFTALYSADIAMMDTSLKLAAQNLFWEDEGPYTGEVSGRFIRDVGCQYVLIGHSERRKLFHETDEMVNMKIQAALKNELIPIVCIGEDLKERESGKTLDVIERQLRGAFNDVAIHDFESLTLAYEPVWAIGTGKVATPVQAGEVHQYIRTWLKKYFDAPTANKIRILYGGSVKPDNAGDLMKEQHVDGLLVGGASLNADDFARIVKFEEGLQ